MQIEWTTGNQYEIAELRARIRDKDVKAQCAAVGCEYKASDVHHFDGDHSNNAPDNLAPACKPCHNKVHDITAQMSDLKLLVRLFYEAQDQRKAAAAPSGYAARRQGLPTLHVHRVARKHGLGGDGSKAGDMADA